MKVIEATVTEIQEQDILKKIELCGRVCYKSEGQISEGSAFHFVNALVKRSHWAMLEHVLLVLSVTQRIARGIERLGHGTFLNVTSNGQEDRYLISGNVRAWHDLFASKKYRDMAEEIIEKCECYMHMSLGKSLYDTFFPNKHTISTNKNYLLSQEDILHLPNLQKEEALAHLYLTAHFICDRGVSHELVRHRPASFAQESTRYCNYSRDAFGKELTFISPVLPEQSTWVWEYAMLKAEQAYFDLLESGLQPQQARGVLPTDIKTEIIMTCNLKEWQHVINLRYHGTTGVPHPNMVRIMTLWYNLVKAKEGYNMWIE